MLTFARRLWSPATGKITVCESSAEACTTAWRAAARFDQARTQALGHPLAR